jgi:lipopolysaccharide transport system permease protein
MSEIQQIRVYTPESSLARPRLLAAQMLRDLAASRGLAWRLALRDVRAQYRQTILGLFWAFLTPLMTAVTWIFLRRSGVVSVGDTGLPYPLYVFSGSILWAILVESLVAPLAQTVTATNILAKLSFPREAVVISGVLQVSFNAGIKIALLIPALIVAGIRPGWGLLAFPLGVLSLVLVGTAIGLLLTPVGMLFTDVRRAIPLVMGLVMFVTPVVFPMPASGWSRELFERNPLSPLILAARAWLTGGTPELFGYFLAVNAVAVVALLVGWVAYRLSIPIFIERLSA